MIVCSGAFKKYGVHLISLISRAQHLSQRCAGVWRTMSSAAHEIQRAESMKPEGTPPPAKLKVFNSLTRSKEEFVPLSGPRVSWYSCGPTVYDAAHMGHARSYITFDILRRVFVDYFNYDVLYVMNITDIDDKIIRRARKQHLFTQYLGEVGEGRGVEDVLADVSTALEVFRKGAESEVDPDKQAMLLNTLRTGDEAFLRFQGCTEAAELKSLLEDVKDPLSSWLDSRLGSLVTDHGIFSLLTRHWEEDYHRDMAALNVLPADVLTRVSEYVPEVIDYVQKIVANGYGYESNGSVYFDVNKFSKSPDHRYAKLVPEAVGDSLALAEGEGVLSTSTEQVKEKKSRNDFVLWKASKLGEPSWPSPWGLGRPGWHIECSVMACDILGERADIHTGGVDLKFPHHDNEIAQAEACYGHDQWMSYFIHSGHLTIEGCKMSKSLKNFITIKAALEQYSWRQLRLAFLLHSWGATLDFGAQTMREAIHWERMFNEFFLRIKDLLRHYKSGTRIDAYCKFEQREKRLNEVFSASKASVHTALCDSIDTPSVMKHLKDLTSSCNIYLDESDAPNTHLLETVALYVTKMLRIFGTIPSDVSLGFPVEAKGLDVESTVLPFASLVSDFREEVRQVSLEVKSQKLLALCDHVRDERLPELGVLLEDKDGRTVVKYVGKEVAIKEKEMKALALDEKQMKKDEQRKKQDELKRAREAAAAVAPEDMFRSQTEKFSRFDETGVPTHTAQGEVITDSQKKKLRKQWQVQGKKYREYLLSKK